MRKLFSLILMMLIVPIIAKAQIVINMEETGGVYQVPCKVNEVPMKFIFDTGASRVCMSLSEAFFMLKNGYLEKSDLKGTTYSQIANGDVVKGTTVILKTIEIGGLKLHNIEATIDNSLTAPLLLGQSAIQKLGSIRLEGNKLIIYNNSLANEGNTALNDFFNKGVFAMNDEKYDDAIEFFKKSIEIQPTVYSYCNIGRCYMLKEDTKTALSYLQKAYSLNSQDPFTIFNIAACYDELENYKVALDYLEMAIRLTTTPYGDKISFKEGCLEIAGNSFYLMGKIYEKNGQKMKAIGAFNSLCKLDPTDARANFELAEIYLGNQNFNEAWDNYFAAIKKNSSNMDNAIVYHKLGLLCLYYKNDTNSAIDMFNKCNNFIYANITNGGLKYAFYQMMSDLYLARIYSQSDPVKSNGLYEKIISFPLEFNPQDFFTMFGNYVKLGDMDKGIAALDSGLVKFPNDCELLFSKAYMDKNNSPQEDLTMYKKILLQENSHKPQSFDYATVYNNIGWAYHLLGESAKGLPYSRKSVELNPNLDYCWETLGELRYDTGDYQGCIDAMKQCLRISDKYKEEANRFISLCKKRKE